MRFAVSLRNLSLGMATASFLLTGAAIGQSSASTTGLAGVNATLDHALNSQSAMVGQAVDAKLDSSVQAANGIDLPKGTELMGKVSQVQASRDGSPARISLIFDKAELKNGKQIPIKAMLLAAAPPNNAGYGYSNMDTEPLGPAPKSVSSQEKVVQEPGTLSHIAMHSSAQSNTSGTFIKKDGNFKLNAGTYLQLGVAPAMGTSNMRSGA